jgi:Erv1 / Alr family
MNSVAIPSLSRESWGPKFWTILHTLAECSGNQSNQILSNDEADAWTLLLKMQTFVMPCVLCKNHYMLWQRTHKYDILRTIQMEERRLWLRNWLWSCHGAVNEMNTKHNPSLEDLPALYPKQNIESYINDIKAMFQQALNTRKLKLEDITKWKYALGRLRVMYGI